MTDDDKCHACGADRGCVVGHFLGPIRAHEPGGWACIIELQKRIKELEKKLAVQEITMSSTMEKYRNWENRLIALRTKTNGCYSPEEDIIIDAMTEAWNELTENEQAILNKDGPKAPNRLAQEDKEKPDLKPGRLIREEQFEPKTKSD